jgi:peptidoglycan hydrolase CwlO-like protein
MDEKEPILSEARPETKPETKLQKILPVVLRWGLVGLIAIVVGALIITFTLYAPTQQKFNKASVELNDANATISEKTDQISTLQAENDNLKMDLEAATLHWAVLEALSGVRGASLAVADDDYAGARLMLIKGTEAIDIISSQLGTDHNDVLTAMQQSAAQALDDMQNDLKSAQPELDQLVNNLVQLEDTLFPNP